MPSSSGDGTTDRRERRRRGLGGARVWEWMSVTGVLFGAETNAYDVLDSGAGDAVRELGFVLGCEMDYAGAGGE